MVESHATILVVEDEESFVEALILGLKREGFLVKVARDGAEALSVFDLVRPDLVLLDVMLPKVNGLDVCRGAASQEPGAHHHGHGHGTHLQADHGVDLAALDDYVTKPYRLHELVARGAGCAAEGNAGRRRPARRGGGRR